MEKDFEVVVAGACRTPFGAFLLLCIGVQIVANGVKALKLL